MTAASPYRAPTPKPISTFVVPLFAVPRGLLVVLLVLFAAPICLHVFLWSRVVTVACQRSGDQQITCAIDEVSLASSSHLQQVATGALAAELRGETRRSRGDAWIVLVDRKGEARLTSGFNGDKAGQGVAAAALTKFLRDPRANVVSVSFGSRWRTAWIFAVLDAILLLLGYALLGQRLRVTADRERDVIDFHRSVWPLPGSRSHITCSRLARFEIENLPKGRFRLVAVTTDGQIVPLSWTLGAGSVLERAVDRLNQWAEAERTRYRTGESSRRSSPR